MTYFWKYHTILLNRKQRDKSSSSAFLLETASSIWEKLKLSAEEVDKFFSNYEAKLSGQMVKSLGKSIMKTYSMGACAVLGMTNQDALSEDLESNPFLNSALQRFTCKLYYRFGSFLAPVGAGLITIRHYLSEYGIKNGETSGGTSGFENSV